VRTVLIPRANEKDVSEVPEEIRGDLAIVPVDSMDQVLGLALDRTPAGAPAVTTDDTHGSDTHGPGTYAH
jgi:ATP-dependent Lon protease